MATLNVPDIPPLTNRRINICEKGHQSEFFCTPCNSVFCGSCWVRKHKIPFELKLHEALEVVDVMAKNKNKIDESIRSLKELLWTLPSKRKLAKCTKQTTSSQISMQMYSAN